MRNSAIISEYNPMHNGHIYQINELKKLINTNVISIMSGDFVQRGECAILDKYKRAKIAVQNGVNLVIELPFFFSLQSAENFSLGAINILNELNIIDNLCFGYECNSEDELYKIANFQIENKKELDDLIKININKGSSYAVAYKDACNFLLKEKNISINDDFFISNNILSIEYLKALKKTNSKICPIPIKRKGQNYNSEDYKAEKQLSATSIRKAILENNFEYIKTSTDYLSFEELKNIMVNKNFQDNYKIMELLKFSIISNCICEKSIVNYENGILKLIEKNIFNYNNFDNLIDNIQSKRYKKVRIKRFIFNYLLNITEEIKNLYLDTPSYIKVLAFDEIGIKILKEIKDKSNLKIITKNKDILKLENKEIEKYNLEKKARKIYKLLTNSNQNEKFINFYIERSKYE